MEIVRNMALISINETLLVQLISFLLFLWVINRIMFRPLHNMMRERDFYLETLGDEIKEAQRSCDRTLADLARQEEAVRDKANALRRQREEEGEADAAAMLNDVRRQVQALHREAEADTARQVAAAREGVAAEAQALAVAMMEKVLERRVDA